ncbi:hypothetical protein COP2_040973 [Malus domestica]
MVENDSFKGQKEVITKDASFSSLEFGRFLPAVLWNGYIYCLKSVIWISLILGRTTPLWISIEGASQQMWRNWLERVMIILFLSGKTTCRDMYGCEICAVTEETLQKEQGGRDAVSKSSCFLPNGMALNN